MLKSCGCLNQNELCEASEWPNQCIITERISHYRMKESRLNECVITHILTSHKTQSGPENPAVNLVLLYRLFGGAIWVVGVWLQLFKSQLSQLKSVLPHLKYKSLCVSSTQSVPYRLSTLITGPSCLLFPPLKGIKHLVCEQYHIESKEYDPICTDKRFDLQDQLRMDASSMSLEGSLIWYVMTHMCYIMAHMCYIMAHMCYIMTHMCYIMAHVWYWPNESWHTCMYTEGIPHVTYIYTYIHIHI